MTFTPQILKIGIIEDDPLISLTLETKIKRNFPKHQILFNAPTSEVALHSLQRYDPDLLITDICLEKNTSVFDVLSHLEEINFKVIFITGVEKTAFSYALVEYPTLNFLVKPLDFEMLSRSIQKMEKLITQKEKASSVSAVRSGNGFEKKILISLTRGRQMLIDLSEIVRIQSNGNLSIIHLNNADNNHGIISIKSLKFYQEKLENKLFFRVHKEHLINMTHIQLLHFRPVLLIELSNGDKVNVSRSKKKAFLEFYENGI